MSSVSAGDDQPRRFLGVFFTDWLIDLEMALLRRTLAQVDVPDGQSLGKPSDGVSCGDAVAAYPLLVVEEQRRTHVILACNGAALALGVRAGMTVSQAEAVCPPQDGRASEAWRGHVTRLRDQRQDWSDRIVNAGERVVAIRWDGMLAARLLGRMAQCLERWIPTVSVPPELQSLLMQGHGQRWDAGEQHGKVDRAGGALAPTDWMVGEFTGCAALFRSTHASEQGLMRRISACFHRRGFRTRLATASTVGTATALARFAMPRQRAVGVSSGRDSDRCMHHCIAVPAGAEAQFLAGLPVESLRVSGSAAAALRAVEVETVGQLAMLQRSGIAARLSGQHAGIDPRMAAGGASHRGAEGKRGGRRSRHAASLPASISISIPTSAAMRGAHEASAAVRISGDTPSLFAPVADSGGGAVRKGAAQASDSALARRKQVRALDDVLRRLDQALGVVAEGLVPLRLRPPIVIEHAFEAPCSRPDVISYVCGDIVERLMSQLARRREGLRAACWSFRHADVPADLSTDACAQVIRGQWQCAGPGIHSDFPERTHSGPLVTSPLITSPLVTSIGLGLARPTGRFTHVWSVLRTRLEQLALDHGVEHIECRVERTVRLRFRQAQLEASVSASPRSDMWGGTASNGGASLATRAEWLDLVTSRLGPSAVVDPSARLDESDVGSHQPHALFVPSERATLHAGLDARALAQSIATRTRWRAQGGAGGARIGCPTQLEWRGAHWSVDALDGWERSSPRWWGKSPPEWVGAVHREAKTGVLSRMSIITGGGRLWLLVRWPERLPAPQRHETSGAMSDAGVRTAGTASAEAAAEARVEQWFIGSHRSLEAGVDVEVLGAWG